VQEAWPPQEENFDSTQLRILRIRIHPGKPVKARQQENRVRLETFCLLLIAPYRILAQGSMPTA